MKKLSKQPYSYICFEIARLRTRWTNDEEHREAIEKRYIEVVKEFNTRTNNWFWTPHKIEKAMEKHKYSKTKCMGKECKEPPTVEVLWAEGIAHAWFCNKHFEEWKKKPNKMSNTETYEGDIVSQRKIDGEACEKWSEPVKKVEFQGHNGKWVTLEGGQKLFIREGESVNEAIGRKKPKKTKITYGKDTSKDAIDKVSDIYDNQPKIIKDHISSIDISDYKKGSEAKFEKGKLNLKLSTLDKDGMDYVMYHELGHVHTSGRVLLSNSEALKVNNKFRSLVKSNIEKPPTDYAKVNMFEDWSESYAIYKTNPSFLKEVAPKRFSLLEEHEKVIG